MTSAVSPPELQSGRLTLERWQSEGGETSGCLRGDVAQWSTDATDVAQGKLIELASHSAEVMRGAPTPMHVTASAHDGRERTLRADDDDTHAHASTYLVFTPGEVHGCFVACVDSAPSCRVALPGDLNREPPPPGVALRSVALVIHHPRGALAGVGVFLLLAAVVAIVTRNR